MDEDPFAWHSTGSNRRRMLIQPPEGSPPPPPPPSSSSPPSSAAAKAAVVRGPNHGCGTPRHNRLRRSTSWCGSSTSGSPLSPRRDGSSSHHHKNGLPSLEEQEEDGSQGRDMQLLCPPLQLLSVSKRAHPKDRNRLINRIRNGADMKLDLEAVERASQDWDDAEGGDSELQHRKERMAECDKKCSCILSHLFMGGRAVAQNLSTLKSCRISHILNSVGFVCPDYHPNDFFYKTMWLQDSPSEDIVCVLYDVFDYIEDVREQAGGRVFVHCCQGVSRSAALVIAYLMWRNHQCFEDAFEEVKLRRSVASPNMGFVAQLMQWQSRILGPPNRQAFRMYRIAPHSAYDPLHLVPKSISNPLMRALDSRGAFVIQMSNRLYVWRGTHCDKEMSGAADRAAFQFVRYEHGQGPIVTVSEGNEPSQMRKALRELHSQDSSEDAINGGEEEDGTREKRVAAYDTDYEMYRKAKSGGYVPPVIGSGAIIHLPARDEKWSRLRPSFLNSPGRSSGKK